MNAFRVHGNNGQTVDIQGEFRVLDNGVLVVKPKDAAVFFMSPGGWTQVNLLDPLIEIGEVMSDLRTP